MKTTQREILRRVSVDEAQFNADLRQIVEESLKKRNVDNADVYNLIALRLNCNGGKATEVEDLYALCKLVYEEWFARMTSKKRKRLHRRAVASHQEVERSLSSFPHECGGML